jgi:hypothetical protein
MLGSQTQVNDSSIAATTFKLYEMSAHAEIAAFLSGEDLAVRADAAAAARLAAAISGSAAALGAPAGGCGTGAAASGGGSTAGIAAAAYTQHGGVCVNGALLVPTSDATIYKLALTALEAPEMHADVRTLDGGLVAVRVTINVPTVATCVVPAADWARAVGK